MAYNSSSFQWRKNNNTDLHPTSRCPQTWTAATNSTRRSSSAQWPKQEKQTRTHPPGLTHFNISSNLKPNQLQRLPYRVRHLHYSTETESDDSFYSLSTQFSEFTENLIQAFSSCIRVQEIQLKAQTSLIERQKENLDLQKRLVSAMQNSNAEEKKTEIANELEKAILLQTRISDFLEKISEQAEEAKQLPLQVVTDWGHLTRSGQGETQDDGEFEQGESEME
jgi:hypothetical protein